MDAVVDLGECNGVGELHFMREDCPRGGVPVGNEGVVAADPFRTNVRIHLHCM